MEQPAVEQLSVERLRSLHGSSTVVWAGGGDHALDESYWLTLSGAAHVDYNLGLFHGPAGEARLRECLPVITARRRPTIIAVAGELRSTTVLSEAGWVRVGGAPLMARQTVDALPDPAVRRLPPAEVPLARALVADTFGLPPDIAAIAVADDVGAVDRTVWGLFDGDTLMSCLLAVRVEDAVVIWSMATARDGRRRGYGRRLLDSVLASSAGEGTATCLLHASSDGEPLYLASGFDIVERWDFWSRRRWVLAAE